MVSEDKIVLDLDHALLVIRVVFFGKKEELRLNGGLIVILLLILNEFHSDHGLRFVVETFQDLSEGALANLFNYLESKAYLVILGDSIIAVGIIVAIVDDSFGLGWVDLVFIRGEIEYFFKFLDLGGLSLGQKLGIGFLGLRGCDRVLNTVLTGLAHILDSQLLALGGLRNNLTMFLLRGGGLLTAISR